MSPEVWPPVRSPVAQPTSSHDPVLETDTRRCCSHIPELVTAVSSHAGNPHEPKRNATTRPAPVPFVLVVLIGVLPRS